MKRVFTAAYQTIVILLCIAAILAAFVGLVLLLSRYQYVLPSLLAFGCVAGIFHASYDKLGKKPTEEVTGYEGIGG